jgi:hypothetical protein
MPVSNRCTPAAALLTARSPCPRQRSVQPGTDAPPNALPSAAPRTVGIDLKGDLDLGGAAGGGRDAGQVKLAQLVVVLGHGALALVHLRHSQGGTGCGTTHYSNRGTHCAQAARLPLAP